MNEVPMEASAAENEEIQKDSPLVFVPTLAARQALKDLEALGAKPSEFWDAVKRSHLKTVSKQMLRENVKKVIPHSKKLSLRKSNKRVNLFRQVADQLWKILQAFGYDKVENFAWNSIFFQRMKWRQNILSVQFISRLTLVLSESLSYEERKEGIAVVQSLLDYLALHKMDPDNCLLGLRPRESLQSKFQVHVSTLSSQCDSLRKPQLVYFAR